MLIHCNVIHSFDVHIFHKQLPILIYIGNVLIQKQQKTKKNNNNCCIAFVPGPVWV